MKKIGDALKAFFKSQGITQKQLSQELNVSQPYINALLSGEKEFGKKQAQIFGDKFGLSPNWLLTGTGNMLLENTTETEHDNNMFSSLLKEKEKVILLLEDKAKLLQEQVEWLKEKVAFLEEERTKKISPSVHSKKSANIDAKTIFPHL